MTNLQYAIMEAYRDNLLSSEVTIDMLETASGELGPNHDTDYRLKKIKEFEDEVVAPAKNSNWWTSEHTAKVNAYLNKIKNLSIAKSLASSRPKGSAIGSVLAGITVAIKYELPANEFKFITNRNDITDYMKEARRIHGEKEVLMSYITDYRRQADYLHKAVKMTAKDPEYRKRHENSLKDLYDRREMAKKKLASVYGVHIV
nr:MAG TPA: hypothetical protein [Caudoviricetes sp.]